jgi:hypothetical protein
MTFAVTEFASRPVQTASAVRMSLLILGAIAGLAAGKALLAQGLTTLAKAEPAVAPIASAAVVAEPAKDVCRRVEVEIDEGYGVRGHVTRWVCRKAY